jgi:hypothetical protein
MLSVVVLIVFYAECRVFYYYAECHMLSVVMLSVVMLIGIFAECRVIYCYAECHYAERRYAKCRGDTVAPTV